MGWIEIEDAKPRVECCVRSPGCCFQSGELQCRAGPIRAGSRQSSRHRRDRLVSEPRWDAPKGKAPSAYVVQCSNGRTMTVAGSQTVATFTNGFDYNRTHFVPRLRRQRGRHVVQRQQHGDGDAITRHDAGGKPVVSSTGSDPTHVDLSWSYADNDPSPRFDIYVNGQLW